MDVILSGLGLLHEPDEIIEIRSIDPKPVISGYCRQSSHSQRAFPVSEPHLLPDDEPCEERVLCAGTA